MGTAAILGTTSTAFAIDSTLQSQVKISESRKSRLTRGTGGLFPRRVETPAAQMKERKSES